MLAFNGGLGEGGAYVQHAGARINTVEDGLGKFLGRRAWHLAVGHFRFGKDGARQQGAAGTNRWGNRSPLGGQNPSYKGAVQAGGTIRFSARAVCCSRHLPYMAARKIGVVHGHGSIDQRNREVGSAASLFHQLGKIN